MDIYNSEGFLKVESCFIEFDFRFWICIVVIGRWSFFLRKRECLLVIEVNVFLNVKKIFIF